METTDANLLLCLLVQLFFVFLHNYLVRLPVRYQKTYIMHLGMPSLYSPQIGRGYFSKGMAEGEKSEGGHVAKGNGQQKGIMTVGKQRLGCGCRCGC